MAPEAVTCPLCGRPAERIRVPLSPPDKRCLPFFTDMIGCDCVTAEEGFVFVQPDAAKAPTFQGRPVQRWSQRFFRGSGGR